MAIAVGVGLAIGTANAQPAAAAPASASDSAHRGPASSGRGAKSTALRRAPAARLTQNNAKRAADATRKPTAVAASARRQGGATAAESSTDSARYPLRNLVVTVKNTHLALPLQTVFFVKQVAGNATFTENTVYDLHNVDQYDWNKLTGISFTFLRPDTDAIMVAWRYNVETQMFEIGPYYNLDTARIMPADDEIISVPADAKFTFNVDYEGIALQYGDTVVYKPIPAGLHPHQLSAFRINSWFGGTSLAPRTISYYMQLKPWWKTL
ncbi:hypothetical protein [Mycolicibacterium vinylchloridicum]|uniref:hypothetical protein n=1 Tax=Mycolicibacterium vinylchloridicum TaxID=2736928 RepID=UPI0015CC105C|nr:hypothetical protein [Mycolicibacterium vinylchloridicum]